MHDFTAQVNEMRSWLQQCQASGGGDGPEAVADGLHAALKLSWRPESTKICVLIADAPPHGLDPSRDGFPNGCPNGLDPVQIVRQMAEERITLYSVGVEPPICKCLVCRIFVIFNIDQSVFSSTLSGFFYVIGLYNRWSIRSDDQC